MLPKPILLPRLSVSLRLIAELMFLVILEFPLAALAQDALLWRSVHQGMNAAELQEAMPEVEKELHPSAIANGARGLWSVRSVEFYGHRYTATVFFRQQRVEHVELQLEHDLSAADTHAAYLDLVRELSEEFGSPVHSDGARSEALPWTSLWVAGERDITLAFSGDAERPVLRILYKPHTLVEADQL